MKSDRARYLGYLAICVLLALFITALEIFAGFVNETAVIREEARKFREEATYLRFSTLSLLPSINHEFLPASRGTGSRFSPREPRKFRTDTRGFIRTGNEKDAPVKILFLGGSTTEANEVDEPLRFPAVVESVLREAGISANSLNAGVRGHTTLDSINALLNRLGMLESKVVVLMHNINDRLRLAASGSYGAQLGNDAPTSALAFIESLRGTAWAGWDYLSYRSNLLFLARSAITRFNPWSGETTAVPVKETSINFPDPNLEAHRILFERNLRVFVAIARALGMRPMLMTQPIGIASEQHAAFNNSVRKVAAELNVMLIDLHELLPEPKSWAFLSDNIHFNNRGSEAVGKLIAERLAPLLGATPKPAQLDTGIVPPDELAARCKEPSESIAPGPARQIVAEPGRYPSFSNDGKWLLFQSWKDGLDRIRILDVQQRRILTLTPEQPTIGERHPAFLSLKDSEFEVVYGQGFDERNPKSIERLMVRHWPSLSVRPLHDDDKMSGAIPAVAGDFVVFPGLSVTETGKAPDLFRFDTGSKMISRITDTKW
jgi:lysophospholipase L1-like esterase